MSTKKNSTMAICLTAILALSPVDANEHEEKFDDGDLSDSDFGSQPCRQLCAGYYHIQR